VVSDDAALARAYEYCAQRARQHYENFPVASWLLPAAMRPHIAAIYAFARAADDVADEPGPAPEERLQRLDDWSARLALAARSPASTPATDPVFVAVGATIEQCKLPVSLFEDLLSAFRQDVTTRRYAAWADVLDYCRRSANPVGRLVLRVAGYDNPRLDVASDALCTALQLTNFWQDLERDLMIGRIYIPEEDMARANARSADLRTRTMTAEWRAVMKVMADRTRELFVSGKNVCDGVTGRLRWELRLTWLGGTRILSRLEQVQFDVFNHRPALGKRDVPGLIKDVLLW
jgi:squalene synthase HpnC